ncbi:MAG: hypothetical protein ACYC5M_18215 [Anaerolineae bacterium]
MTMGALDEVVELFTAMCAEVRQWREEHPEATLDEIAAQLTPRRQHLMGQLLIALALQPGDGYALEGVACPGCGTAMVYKGHPTRQVDHLEGAGELPRAYYHCPGCGQGFFPPRQAAGAGAAPLDPGDPEPCPAPGGGCALGAPGSGAL